VPWMDWVHQFLRHTHGQIILKSPWISAAHRHKDRHIMSDILDYNLPKNHLITINSIRLHLCVNQLSKITDLKEFLGDEICQQEAKNCFGNISFDLWKDIGEDEDEEVVKEKVIDFLNPFHVAINQKEIFFNFK